MQKKYMIGVGLGTRGTKAALYQIDGKLISDASVEVPLYYPKPGVVEQENEDFYTSAAQTVKKSISLAAGDRPPHLGAQTDGATSNMGWFAMRDCLAVLKNEKPTFRVA